MNFIQDRVKMLDFITLSKAEFLNRYTEVSEQEYDNTATLYHLT